MGLNLTSVFSMVRGLEIKMDTKGLVELRDTLGKYATKLPKAMNTDIKTIAEDYAFEMAFELGVQRLRWKGKLISSCVAKEIEKDTYAIAIPEYGFYLDRRISTKPVPLWKASKKTGQQLGDWATDPSKIGLPKDRLPSHMVVHKHPWMKQSFRRARAKIERRLERGEFHKTIERKGR